jgi:hypothetical protein
MSWPPRLRQIACVVADLEATSADVEAVLLTAPTCGGPGAGRYGLSSRVFPIGDSFLELVAPDAREMGPAGRRLARQGGDCGYMVCLQTTQADRMQAGVGRSGARVVEDLAYPGGRTVHLHPADIRGAIVSVDATPDEGRWPWGGMASRGLPCGEDVRLSGVSLAVRDPVGSAHRWACLADVAAEAVGGGAWRLRLRGAEVRFAASRPYDGEGLAGVLLSTSDPKALQQRAAARGLVDADGALRLAGLRVALAPFPEG